MSIRSIFLLKTRHPVQHPTRQPRHWRTVLGFSYQTLYNHRNLQNTVGQLSPLSTKSPKPDPDFQSVRCPPRLLHTGKCNHPGPWAWWLRICEGLGSNFDQWGSFKWPFQPLSVVKLWTYAVGEHFWRLIFEGGIDRSAYLIIQFQPPINYVIHTWLLRRI